MVERHVANVNVEGSTPFTRFLRLYLTYNYGNSAALYFYHFYAENYPERWTKSRWCKVAISIVSALYRGHLGAFGQVCSGFGWVNVVQREMGGTVEALPSERVHHRRHVQV